MFDGDLYWSAATGYTSPNRIIKTPDGSPDAKFGSTPISKFNLFHNLILILMLLNVG